MLEKIRLKLAGAEALPLLALLGIVVGVFAAMIIIAFRLVIETSQAAFLPQGNVENYEALSLTMRFVLPFLGALSIGALFYVLYRGPVPVGVMHVLERLAYHQANLPFRNFIAQFTGGAISIICGHSVGREGPGVHLGAAAGSFIGQWLKLPNNTLRILVACGTSASIAASFNTPIAGVIFAMEVIVMEYTIAGFAPIMLSAVSGALLTQAVFGADPVFSVPALKLATIKELAVLLVMGLAVGSLAAGFIRLLRITIHVSANVAYLYRMGLAGLLTGACAMVLPQVMGIGYDTMNAAITGELGIGLLIAIVVAKMLVTTIGLGLGLPGGLIGPTLIIGAAAGGVTGIVAQSVMPNDVASVGFFAVLGMAAMMGATLQAPLAALMALLELTVNTNIILPGMLVVIVASLTSSHLFRQQGVFIILMKERGLDFRNNPIAQALRRVGVSSIMSRSFVQTPYQLRRQEAQSLLQTEPEWIVIEKDNTPTALMPSVDLAQYLTMNQQDDIDLLDIPGQRYDCMAVGIRDTLQTVLDRMEEQQQEVVYVGQQNRRDDERYLIHGIVTRQMIETHYRYY